MTKSVLAIAAHPDDIEIFMAGTLLLLQDAGYEVHYLNIANGCCGTTQYDYETILNMRRQEAINACDLVGFHYYESICNDLEVFYTDEMIKKVAAVVRQAKAQIVLTHSPEDYMEDHTNSCRLATTAAFTRVMPNYPTIPPTEPYGGDCVVYHAVPHGLMTPLRKPVKSETFINIESVIQTKEKMLACHQSQKVWLDESQGMDSYIVTMVEFMKKIGKQSGRFACAEAWRRHLHWGYSQHDTDPLYEALKDKAWRDSTYSQND